MTSIVGLLTTIWSENSGSDRFVFLIRGIVWQLRKRLGISTVTRLPNGALIKVFPHSAFSGIFYSRWVEKKDLLFIRAHATLAPTFVDVGANVGLFSVSLFDMFSRFVMIEPTAASVRALRETCALNPSVQCTILDIAASDKAGMMEFIDEGDFSTTGRIATRSGDQRPGVRSVQVDTLDHLLNAYSDKFILKVDVEGHEEQVFRGCLELFSAKRIRLVMFERLGRSSIDNILRFFGEVGYTVFAILDDHGTISCDDRVLRTPLMNLFACPSAIFSSIAGRPN